MNAEDELRAEVERLRIELHRVAESRQGQRERAERLRAALLLVKDWPAVGALTEAKMAQIQKALGEEPNG